MLTANVLTCVAAESNQGDFANSLCPPSAAGQYFHPQVVQAVLLESTDAQANPPVPFDSAQASEIFGFGFALVVGSYFTAFGVGQISKILRRGH